MQMQLALYDPTTNTMITDWSLRVVSCHVKTGLHGYEACEAELRIPFYEAFLYYQQFGPLVLRVLWGGYKLWEGRLEDPTQFTATQSGLKIVAFGAWVAFNDTRYTALWAKSTFDGFRPTLTTEVAIALPDRYEFNFSNQVYIAARKNSNLGNTGAAKAGIVWYQLPDQVVRGAVGVSFDFKVVAPAANWRAAFQTYDATFTGIANPWLITSAGAGTKVGSINVIFTGEPIVGFLFDFNAADAVFAGETNTAYLQITNLKLVTSNTNRINTTLGTNIAAGTRTVTPGSIVGMYVGQRLQIDQASTTISESVVITAISAGTFTAVFVFAHVIASTVNAMVVYPEEVIKDMVATVSTLNTSQLSSDVTLIQSQAIDQDQLVFEDQLPTDIINQMLAKSDNATVANQWVGLVYDNKQLITRTRGSGTKWYVDVATLEIVRTLTNLYNSVYAVYNDPSNNRKLRTVLNTDTGSVSKFQIIRITAVSADTTNLTQAAKLRDATLVNQADPIPRASITINRVFDQYGTPYPLFFMRVDDTITLRNLPPVLGQAYDKIRTLVVTHTDYDIFTNKITLELEIPLPDQSIMLARALKG